jgi:hypothetical protein
MFSQNLFNLFLIILYFNQNLFSEYSGVFRFVVLYFPFCISFLIKLTKFYFNFVKRLYSLVVYPFFPSIVPPIVPFIFLFHFCFNLVWTIYILIAFYSVSLFSIPLYIYSFYQKEKYSVYYEFGLLISIYFFQIYEFEVAYSMLALMINVNYLQYCHKKSK